MLQLQQEPGFAHKIIQIVDTFRLIPRMAASAKSCHFNDIVPFLKLLRLRIKAIDVVSCPNGNFTKALLLFQLSWAFGSTREKIYILQMLY